MTTRAGRRQGAGDTLQRGLWWALVGVFVAVGLVGVYRGARQQAPGAPGDWETTDAWLGMLEVPSPSLAVRESLRQAPASGAVLFVGSASDPTYTLTYYITSYLAWPRVVGALQCGAQDREAVPYLPVADRVTSVLFYQRPAPAFLGQGAPIGPHMSLVTEREKREWTDYCSR